MKPLKVYDVGDYDKLNPRQKAWLDFYISTNYNSTEATRLAGYNGNETQTRRIGFENAKKFVKLIAERTKDIESKRVMELKDIFNFWSDTIKADDEKMEHRIKCSELLAKAKGGFVERVELNAHVDNEAFKDLTTEELRKLAK